MGNAYTPALTVSSLTTITKTRELPLLGKAEVSVGDTVSATTPVLTAELPGDLDIIRAAERMSMDIDTVIEGLQVSVGEHVEKGQILFQTKTLFGLLRSELRSPVNGIIEFFTESNTHLGIRQKPVPLTINAYISGSIIEVQEGKSVTIKTPAALIQGIFGVGGESSGRILPLEVSNDAIVCRREIEELGKEVEGCVLVGGSSFDSSALSAAEELKAAAVVTGSIDASTLHNYVGFEIGVSITGDEDVPFPLIISEGFGKLPMSPRITLLAKRFKGQLASVNGTTQVRAGAMRPEIIIPRSSNTTNEESALESNTNVLNIGAKIRIIRNPHFGKYATVLELAHKPEKIESGAIVRILLAKLEDGSTITVPRANVELM